MSQRELEAVIGRAILDQGFRMELFANPPAALAEYELTEAEVAALRMVDAEGLDACTSHVGQRVLHALLWQKIHAPCDGEAVSYPSRA